MDLLAVGNGGFEVALDPSSPACRWVGWYLSPWWARTPGAVTVASVHARVDPVELDRLLRAAGPPSPVTGYYRRPATRHGEDLVVLPAERVAMRRVRGEEYEVIGADEGWVRFATSVLVRQLVRARLEHDGWVMCHAAAVVVDGRGALLLGDSGSGKSAGALGTCVGGEAQLLANDRSLVRVGTDGIEALAWAMPISLGLGLLDALGWYEAARASVLAGARQHHFQPQQVTEALRRGDRTPMRDDAGRELKYELYPHHLREWFGIELARRTTVSAVVFPRYGTADATVVERLDPMPADELFLDDSAVYPNLLAVPTAPAARLASSRAAVRDGVEALPRWALRWSGWDEHRSGELAAAVRRAQTTGTGH